MNNDTATPKTDWNFKLFYQSEDDPKLKEDLNTTEKDFSKFSSKYKKDPSYTVSKDALFNALTEYENIVSKSSVSRPYSYLFLRADSNSNNKKIDAMFTQTESLMTELRNKILFFPLSIATIDKKIQKNILSDMKFSHFHYFLKVLWDEAKYNLSEKEEKIMSVMYQPSKSMWVSGVEKVLNNQKIEHEGKEIPISQAQGIVSDLGNVKRKQLHKKITEAYMSISDFAEAEINAVYTTKKISDELRGFAKPYTSVVLEYQNDIDTVETLVNVVSKNFRIAHRFYEIKARMLGLKKLGYADRAVRVGKIKQSFSFDDGFLIIKNALKKVDQNYVEILDRYLTQGHIDVYPKVGKSGGAYCFGNQGLPTFILHNYTDSFNSVNTLAHELGHAFHSEFANTQSGLYSSYTTPVAEVASTLFENFAFEEMFETLSDEEKIIALHDKINSSVSTIFRQIACFNFENELHNTIREKGFVSKEEIANIMNVHMKAYLGPLFDLTTEDGYFFVNWSHIRRHFYVYSYAFGEIVSNALYSKYKKDKAYMKKIEEFMKAGGSKSPYQIFKDIGVDISKEEFYTEGLELIKKDIQLLDRLVKKA